MPTTARGSHLSKTNPPGPLDGILPVYTMLLAQQGYFHKYAVSQSCLLADLNRWLLRHGKQTTDLSEQTLQQYCASRRHRRFRSSRNEHSILQKFVAFLREEGLLPRPPDPCRDSPGLRIEDEFDRYLAKERGLVLSTRLRYRYYLRRFLSSQSAPATVGFPTLQAEDVTRFVREQAPHLTADGAGVMVTALRAFFRFLRQRGEISRDLAGAVPSVANWHQASLPRFLQPHQVHAVLTRCDRRTLHGRRDYAILLLLARLGVRACEVVSLTLEDISWQSGEITIHGKAHHAARLPLPPDVGRAIALYLKDRPPCATRHVFLCLRAPRRAFKNSEAVSTIVARRLKAAGIDCPYTGAHVFRHTIATEMLRRGGSLAEIAQLLGHQSYNTTTIYAKVDFKNLRPLAKAWPTTRGGVR